MDIRRRYNGHRYKDGDISQQALADEYNVNQSAISRIIRGVGYPDGVT